MVKLGMVVLGAGLWLTAAPVSAVELSGLAGASARWFLHSPSSAVQESFDGSLVLQPEVFHDWANGQQSLVFTPFLRLDSVDARRSHWDVRELLWQTYGEDWELRAGLGKVFWGVTEAQHLVDVINQTDLVESIDGEEKLGQPMVNLTLIRNWGTLDFFVLPYFRERTFAGERGRPRANPAVDTGQTRYESSAAERHVDIAVRWTHSLGDWDLGLAHFYGTNREPEFDLGRDAQGLPALVPRYGLIHQTGLDVQATLGAWAWKLELMRRAGQGKPFLAMAGGFEVTLVGLLDSSADLGLLMEYFYDERGAAATTPFEHDVFLGLRYTLNDAQSTEILAGAIVDLGERTRVFSVEASRRLGDRWRLELEARFWTGVAANDPQFSVRNDDFLQVTLSRYF